MARHCQVPTLLADLMRDDAITWIIFFVQRHRHRRRSEVARG